MKMEMKKLQKLIMMELQQLNQKMKMVVKLQLLQIKME